MWLKPESASTVEIYGSLPHRLGGEIKFLSISHGKVSAVQVATGGPIFELNSELYQITAGHGMRFDDPDAKVHYSTSDLDECEFDGQSGYDENIATSIGSDTPQELSTQSSDDDSSSSRFSDGEAAEADHQSPLVLSPHTKIEPDRSFPPSTAEAESLTEGSERMHLQFHNLDLDYVLLKLPTQPSSSGPTQVLSSARHESNIITTISHIANNARVLVMSPIGPIQGTISPEITSYKMRGFTKLQQLLTVELDGVFLKGYSGSAVIDFETGAAYGQIALGSPGHSQAYCVRAPTVFGDILSRLGHVPILDERQWQVNHQHGIRDTNIPLQVDPTNTEVPQRLPDPIHEETLKPVNPEYKSEKGILGARNVLEKQTLRSKRRRGDDSSQPSNARSRGEKASRQSTPNMFACPFYLHDRLRYRDCLKKRLKTFGDVRQHLVRAHLLLPQCPNCGEEFKDEHARDSHVRDRDCRMPSSTSPPHLGVTRAQCEVMPVTAGRRRVTGAHAEMWFQMWETVFPGTPPPPSPYIEDHPSVQHISDMNNAIFAGEQWRELVASTNGSRPMLEDASRHIVMGVAERLLEIYRRMYQDPDRMSSETVARAVAESPVARPMFKSRQRGHAFNVDATTVTSQAAKADEDSLSGQTAVAVTDKISWGYSNEFGGPLLGLQSPQMADRDMSGLVDETAFARADSPVPQSWSFTLDNEPLEFFR